MVKKLQPNPTAQFWEKDVEIFSPQPARPRRWPGADGPFAVVAIYTLTLYSYFDQREQAILRVQYDEIVAVRNLATIQETMINNSKQLFVIELPARQVGL
jgi:hypothetical protein